MSDHSDFVLSSPAYSSDEGPWKSPPVSFTTAPDSYAELTGTGSIAVTRGFSWIGAIYRRSTTDGPLLEWDNGAAPYSHIWVFNDRLHVGLVRTECGSLTRHYGTTVDNDKWLVFAVSYDGQTNTISLYVDGQRESFVVPECVNGMQDGNNLRINRR